MEGGADGPVCPGGTAPSASLSLLQPERIISAIRSAILKTLAAPNLKLSRFIVAYIKDSVRGTFVFYSYIG
jgi:hypothetical protein